MLHWLKFFWAAKLMLPMSMQAGTGANSAGYTGPGCDAASGHGICAGGASHELADGSSGGHPHPALLLRQLRQAPSPLCPHGPCAAPPPGQGECPGIRQDLLLERVCSPGRVSIPIRSSAGKKQGHIKG